MQVKAPIDIPKISVIVPCYNVEQYIGRAINSLLKQTFQSFEIIAVDDGSSDSTGTKLDEWMKQHSKIRVIKQTNQGSYAARLAGLTAAYGEWLTFMDADDEVLPEHLETLWSGIGESVGVVVGGIREVRLDGSEHIYIPRLLSITALEAASQLLTSLHHSDGFFSVYSKLYHRKILSLEMLKGVKCNLGDDQIFNLRVFRNAGSLKVVAIPKATYRYILRHGSITTSMSSRHIEDFFEFWAERDAFAKELLGSNEAYWKKYYKLRIIYLTKFLRNIYRSRNSALMRQFASEFKKWKWSFPIPFKELSLFPKWLKFWVRMILGKAGWFIRF